MEKLVGADHYGCFLKVYSAGGLYLYTEDFDAYAKVP